jgi:hypothetical protein
VRALLALGLLLSLPASADWIELGTFDGTKVEKRLNKEGPPTIRCTFTFDAPLEDVKPIIASLQWQRWLNDVHTWKVSGRDDDKREAHGYGRHKVPWPLADRDYAVKMKWKETPDSFELNTFGGDPEGPKPIKGVVRLIPRGTWLLKRAGPSKTRFIYTYKGGAGGNVPDWMVEGNYKSEGPTSIRKMVKLLEKKR